MDYDKEIWRILLEAGDAGLSIQKLSRHVYNACNSLFMPADFSHVHQYVSQFLSRHSKDPQSMITHTGQRGIYRLNPDNQQSRQLMLQFKEEQTPDDDDTELPSLDLSLSLF